MTEACDRSRQGRIVTRLEDMAEELAKLRGEHSGGGGLLFAAVQADNVLHVVRVGEHIHRLHSRHWNLDDR